MKKFQIMLMHEIQLKQFILNRIKLKFGNIHITDHNLSSEMIGKIKSL